MIKVVKFGGSSLASAEQFEKVKNIVTADPSRKIVIVSAPGKRFSGDTKVTDLLYICKAHLKYNAPCTDIFNQIRERYINIKRDCKLTVDIESDLDEIERKLSKNTPTDYIASRGEFLCAKLMAEYLGYHFVESAKWLVFNHDGRVNFEVSYEKLREIYAHHDRIVIPGFYGALPDGTIKVFSRGGSDITGSLAAAAIGADAYENWTDVSGMLMADPRIVENPKPIDKITFAEMRELSCMGAEVLHEDAVFPLRNKDIPLYIKNTNKIHDEGTLVLDEITDTDADVERFITGISGKKNYTLITIAKTNMSEQFGYIRRALQVLEKFEMIPEHIPSSIDSFSFLIPTKRLQGNIHEIVTRLNEELQPDSIKVTNELAVVAVIGRRMAYNPGISGRVFAALGENGINIRMIEQGADEINITIGIEAKDFEHTIKILYNSFA